MPVDAVKPIISADFINDIVVVCTLAILIGQHLCGDINREVDNKRRDLRNYLTEIDGNKEIIKDENIGKLYDSVKNFSLFNTLTYYMGLFYAYIMGCLFLDIVSLNRNTGKIEFLLNFPVETTRFWFEILIWITLGFYAYALAKTRRSHAAFNQNLHNLYNGLHIAEAFYSKERSILRRK